MSNTPPDLVVKIKSDPQLTDCYLDYSTEIESVEHKIKPGEEAITKLVDLTVARSTRGEVHLLVRRQSTCVILFGRNGALCVSLGLTDYGKLTQSHRELGNLVYEYQAGGKTYVTIVYRCLVEYLKGIAEQQYHLATNKEPDNVFLKVTSLHKESQVTNLPPPSTDRSPYIKLDTYHANPEPSRTDDINLSFTHSPVALLS